jgi:hypothetical protein
MGGQKCGPRPGLVGGSIFLTWFFGSFSSRKKNVRSFSIRSYTNRKQCFYLSPFLVHWFAVYFYRCSWTSFLGLLAQKRSKKRHQQNQLQNFHINYLQCKKAVMKILQFALFPSNPCLFSMVSCNASHVLDPSRTHVNDTIRRIFSSLKINFLIFN